MWATTKPSLEALLLLARLISTIIPTTCAIHAPLPDSLGAHTTSISSRHLTDTEAPAFAPAPAPAAFDDYDYSGSYDYGSEEPVADFPLLPDLELVPAPSGESEVPAICVHDVLGEVSVNAVILLASANQLYRTLFPSRHIRKGAGVLLLF